MLSQPIGPMNDSDVWIRSSLQQHASSTILNDETVVEYLQQWLSSALFDDGGRPVDWDTDLMETVAQFLHDHDEDNDSNHESEAQYRTIATLILDSIVQSARGDATAASSERVSGSSHSQDDPMDDTQTPKMLNQPTNLRSQIDAMTTAAETEHTTTTGGCTTASQSRIAQRKMQRKARKRSETTAAATHTDTATHHGINALDFVASLPLSTEDDASAWHACLATQTAWGGRGHGGRGAYAGRVNSVHGTIHLTISSLSLDNGTELLADTTLDIVKGHVYGLVGRNGVGKSTLLRRLAHRLIPGMPHGMQTLLVEQSLSAPGALASTESLVSALDALVESDRERTALLKEQEQLEASLGLDDTESAKTASVAQCLERLSIVAADLDAMQADTARVRAEAILKGLQFTTEMIHGPVTRLSGGWRMRLSLARALFLDESTDLHVWDEVSNHLDLQGLDWLIDYVRQKEEITLIVVSHDRSFLDAICTDIIVMEHQSLTHHVGNYSDYVRHEEETAARHGQILDAAERQRSKAQAFVEQQQATAHKKSADPNKLRQAKMVRDKKLERIGNYREDGKRYKLRSLKTLDEKSSRLAQQVTIEVDDPIAKIYFPQPTWPPSVSPNDCIVSLENLSLAYTSGTNPSTKWILNDVTLHIQRGSKIALVGPNGSGKSSLIQLMAGKHSREDISTKGTLWLHPTLRIGHVSQYTVEHLQTVHAHQTVVEYTEEILRSGRASSQILAQASGNVRQYLGAFGLGSTKHALSRIGTLSGGELMRLSFAVCMADNPGLLLLDEANNHVAIETLDAMATALRAWDGAVLMVSHNQAFLSGFCHALWVLDTHGSIRTVHPHETDSFDSLFSAYRHDAGSTDSVQRQRQKTTLAKRANAAQRGGRQTTALL